MYTKVYMAPPPGWLLCYNIAYCNMQYKMAQYFMSHLIKQQTKIQNEFRHYKYTTNKI